MGKGCAPDKRSAEVGLAIGQLIDKKGDLAEPCQIRNRRDIHFELQAWNHGGQVAITGSLAIAIHRPLNLNGSSPDRRQGIGCSHSAVVVRVDSHLAGKTGLDNRGDLGNLVRHCSPVGIAEHEHIRTCISGGSER